MFQKATKAKSRLRCTIYGPSGSGKTYTCLRIATGIGGKVALIDTERMSASKYADAFEFDTCDLTDRSIDGYCDAIEAAGKAGYNVIVIDSLSHAWRELCQSVEKLANAKYRGNTWSAWSEGTPQQQRLVDTLLDFPGHVLATMRSKTEWQTTQGENGKGRPIRVGLAPEQGKGIEYEFDLVLQMNPDHTAVVEKDRSGRFQDEIIEKPGEEFGKALLAWLSDGSEPVAKPPKKEPTAWSEQDKWPDATIDECTIKVVGVAEKFKGEKRWLVVTGEDIAGEGSFSTFHLSASDPLNTLVGCVCNVKYIDKGKSRQLMSITPS